MTPPSPATQNQTRPFTLGSHDQAQCLMNLAATLGELTQSADQLANIPKYLARSLDIDRITVAIIRDTPVGPEVVLSHSSGDFPKDSPRFAEETLTLYFRTRPVSESHGPVFRADATLPDAIVMPRDLTGGLRMLLIAHQSPQLAAPAPELLQILPAIATTLARFLASTTAWLFHPETLGAPFSALTHREWTVLRALNTGSPEKQLADQLSMSRHTLHSHVKAIYRKIGVPGRVPLMLRMQALLREARIANLEMRLEERK